MADEALRETVWHELGRGRWRALTVIADPADPSPFGPLTPDDRRAAWAGAGWAAVTLAGFVGGFLHPILLPILGFAGMVALGLGAAWRPAVTSSADSPPTGPVSAVRATADHVLLRRNGRWYRYEWSWVTHAAPDTVRWPDGRQSSVWRVTVENLRFCVVDDSRGRYSVCRALDAASRHNLEERRRMQQVPEGALSAADERSEGEDRGLSHVDA